MNSEFYYSNWEACLAYVEGWNVKHLVYYYCIHGKQFKSNNETIDSLLLAKVALPSKKITRPKLQIEAS
jgi:hypothetical protein